MAKKLSMLLMILCLVLLLPMVFFATDSNSYADSENDYIQNTILMQKDGKVSVSIVMSSHLPNNYNVLIKNAFKTELLALLNQDADAKKEELTAKYQADPQEGLSPDEVITFYEAVGKTDNYVGYEIVYNSVEAYRFYNNVQYSYTEGFFMDKVKQVLDNPFNDIIEIDGSSKTVAEKYKDIYISAANSCGLADNLIENYSPYFYNDYVTLNRRTKSSAHSVAQDSENYYHHIWISNNTLTSDSDMVLTLNVIHSGWWYLLGTMIPLGIMLIAIIVVKIINKSKSKTLGDTNERRQEHA